MGVVDRTADFRQILNELSATGNLAGCDGPAATPQAQSKMNIWSAEIGGEIHQASMKVQELRKMARKKGLFDDKTNEIQALTADVHKDMQMLQKKIEVLEAEAKGTGANRTAQTHSSNMVTTLKTRLMEVGKDFKDALEDRTKALEAQDKRRNIYQQSNPFAGGAKNSPAPRAVGNADDLEGGGGMSAQTQYQNNRVDAVQNVQRTIGELAQMFQKMASMVTEQEEMIQRIDHDLDDTLDNVNNAQDNLLKYFKHISSNRGLIIKVFLILIFFVVFFVIFLA